MTTGVRTRIPSDVNETGRCIVFCPYAFGTFAIDVTVVAEVPGSVIEQQLTAGVLPPWT